LDKNELSPELNRKVKKNLLWIFIFAVIMIFAGLTSGYLVSQGSYFWVAIKMPSGFMMSTIMIILSSLALFAAVFAVKRGQKSLLKSSLGIALIGGILFGYFQFTGFKQLFHSGNAVTGKIMTLEGRYGEYFSLTYEGKAISFKQEKYYLKGEVVSEEIHGQIRQLGEELMKGSRGNHKYQLSNYGDKFLLYYKDQPITYSNEELFIGDPLEDEVHRILWYFAENLANDRGDFIMDGVYGEDFWIYYGGEKLDYENRKFYLKGQELSPKQNNDLFSQDNMASSYVYALTGMHLLHWVGGIISLLVVFIRGLGNKYTKENYLGITLGSIYWHFLGILWLYLYAFLIFIH
jgi:cytochrome c oxidase subunit 3